MSEDFYQIMEERNPFMFRDRRERFCIYKDYAEAYLGMMDRLYEMAPKGYIDLVLFLSKYVHLERSSAEEFLQNFYRSGALEKNTEAGRYGICFVCWSDVETSRWLLERIATGLHWVTETKFNQSMFNQGFNMWKLKMKQFK